MIAGLFSNMVLLAAKSNNQDMDFMIKGIYKLPFGNLDIWITTTHISILMVCLILIIFSICVNKKLKNADEVPGRLQNFMEYVVSFLDDMVNNTMGKNAKPFRNYIGFLFIFILVSNLSGVIGIRPPTADFGVTFCLAIISFVLIQFNGIRSQKWEYLKGLFEPIFILFPFNVIGELATPISLSLRLFANILSGTMMIGLWYALLPKVLTVGIPGVFHIYFDLFSGLIQTYVFCMLTIVFIKDKIGE